VGILGLTISLIGITIPSVWYDEAATIVSSTRSWSELWAMIGNVDAVHALYYAVMHLVFDVFGYSPFTLRMPSAVAAGGAAALVVVLGRQLGSARLGLVAGVVFCIIPRVTWMGTEGRSYAATALLAALSTVVLLAARRSGSRRAWVAYGFVAAASCLLFIYLALVIVAHGVTLALLARRAGTTRRLRAWAVATAIAGAVMLPFAALVIAQSGQLSWIEPIGIQTVHEVVLSQWFWSWPFAIAAWAFIGLGVVMIIRRGRHRSVLAVLIPAMIVPATALILFSVTVSPLYQPRYLTMCTPFVALAIAYGILSIRWRLAPVIAVGLLVVLAVPQIIGQRVLDAKDGAVWSEVADLIAEQRALDGHDTTTAIVYGTLQRHPKATARVMEYAYPAAFAGTVDPTLRTPAAQTAQLWETRAPIADSLAELRASDADVVYLITSFSRDQRPATTAALASVGYHVDREWALPKVHVLRYSR
jgi:mannosyltransferase